MTGAPQGLSRTVLHADMDAFYAAIEQRDRPELRGRPVVVGGSGPRQVVSTASYEARKFGVHSAMPGVRARQLCPQAVFVLPRMDVYAAVSAQVRAVFDRFTDLVEPLSLDEAFLDVTGSRALFGCGATIARRIKDEVQRATELTVSVGVATSKYVAKVASDLKKPDGLVVVPPGEERAFLAPLPVSRLWGVGPTTQQQLERAGLRTIADVQSRSERQLVQAFGDSLGPHLFVLANGLDPRAVEPLREARSIGHEMTFAEDLTDADEVRDTLLQLCQMVGRRLRREGVRGSVVRLKLRHPDFTTLSRQRKVAATADDLELHRTVCELLAGCWPGRPGVRLLGVTAAQLVPFDAPVQGGLFAAPPQKRDRLLAAMDRIRDRHGESAVRHGVERRHTNPWGPSPE
ncbi:MAG: DNA polymerase IV [Planctomycetes bacterium]|nr:DNA polymerase IV [Planctomycetota bacterium]